VVVEGADMVIADPIFHDGYTPIRPREVPGILTQPRRRTTRVVTAVDAHRLLTLLRQRSLGALSSPEAALRSGSLEAELKHATILDARTMPGNVVTMNSSLVCEDECTGEWSRVKLVYPRPVHSHDHISVLHPLGTALLGMMVGQVVEATATGEAATRLRIAALPYQPERAGDYHL
jgi:regulator of nucleoside diphosphate kinase